MKINALAGLLILSGCATEVVSTQNAIPVPPNRILAANMLQPSQGSASLIVKRDSGILGMPCNFRLFVNGRPFADIAASEKVQIYVAPGEHILSVAPGGTCLNGDAEAAATVAAGQTRIYRVGIGSGGEMKLQPTAF